MKLFKISGLKAVILLAVSLFSSGKELSAAEKNTEIVSIDVFAKCSSNVDGIINSFNARLEAEGLLKKYSLTPFIATHHVHLTLYLTEYGSGELPKIEESIEKISKNWQPFAVQTTKITLTGGNWIMLGARNNEKLQKLCDEITVKLAPFRNKASEIPSWAKSIPAKKKSFELYGSPNTFDQFDPHFSILAADISPENQKDFTSDITELIDAGNIKPVDSKIEAIGIGYTDSYGQLTQIISLYPLK